jgi:CcmD family protein
MMDANYVVMAVTLIVWFGIFLYLLSIDRKVRRLEGKNES